MARGTSKSPLAALVIIVLVYNNYAEYIAHLYGYRCTWWKRWKILELHSYNFIISVDIFRGNKRTQCNGINVNNICIVSSVDLHRLDYKYDPQKNHQTFFHNKFFIEKDQVVMDCAETELIRRNREECLKDAESLHLSSPYYSACDSAWQRSWLLLIIIIIQWFYHVHVWTIILLCLSVRMRKRGIYTVVCMFMHVCVCVNIIIECYMQLLKDQWIANKSLL